MSASEPRDGMPEPENTGQYYSLNTERLSNGGLAEGEDYQDAGEREKTETSTGRGSHRAPDGGKKKWWLIALAVALALVVVQLVLYQQNRSQEQDTQSQNEVTVSATTAAKDKVESGPDQPSPENEQSPVPADPTFVDEGEQEIEMEPAPGAYPGNEGMSITVNGRTAPIDPVQLTTEGYLIPPKSVERVGWYSASAMPGSEGGAGSTVITGHINFTGQGDGFAANFPTLQLGDTFTITVDGAPREFKVVEAPFRVGKDQPMPAVVNDRNGPNKVVLITCGGQFVGGSLGYADNIFTVAEPV